MSEGKSEKRPPGRPAKLTATVKKRLLESIGRGMTYSLACKLAGIDYSTFKRWMEKGGEHAVGEYRAFRAEVEAQEAQNAEDALLVIQAAALGAKDKPGDWRASAWLLERRHKDDFGAQRVEVTGKDGGPVEAKTEADVAVQIAGEITHEVKGRIDLTKLTDEQLGQLEGLIDAASAGEGDGKGEEGGKAG